MKEVILFGAGGYSDNIRLILDSKCDYKVVGYLDEEKTGEYHGMKILGNKVEDIEEYEKYCYFVCIGDISNRKRIFEELKSKNLEMINVISEYAYMSKDLKIGVGNYIAPGAKIMADVEVKDDNYIGTSSIIEHGSRVGSHCRISSNSTINGEAVIGDEVFFGSSAVCNECLSIGDDVVIGSGSVVLKDVPTGVTAVGVPAKVIRKSSKEKLVILGAGQQGRNCKRLAEELLIDVVAFVDDYEKEYVEGVKVYRSIRSIKDFEKYKYIVAIGQTGIRRRFIEEIKELGLDSMNLIDPKAVIEEGASIGVGNYIYKNAIVYKSATIGDHNIINAKALLATDCVIGENCNISFGSNVCGDCHIGDDSVIGYNATVASGFNVGHNCRIEANSVVYRNVEDNEYVEGVVR